MLRRFDWPDSVTPRPVRWQLPGPRWGVCETCPCSLSTGTDPTKYLERSKSFCTAGPSWSHVAVGWSGNEKMAFSVEGFRVGGTSQPITTTSPTTPHKMRGATEPTTTVPLMWRQRSTSHPRQQAHDTCPAGAVVIQELCSSCEFPKSDAGHQLKTTSAAYEHQVPSNCPDSFPVCRIFPFWFRFSCPKLLLPRVRAV